MTTRLEDILVLEQLDANLFRSRYHCENHRQTLFGGQVLGQALMAAYHTQSGQLPHSLHAYFLRAGSSDTPVIYDVETVRDGRSITSRRVVARQKGRPIFNMSASFHKKEEGYQHQVDFPRDILKPAEILQQRKDRQDTVTSFKDDNTVMPFDFVPVDNSLFSKDIIDPPFGYFWLKTTEKLPDEPINHLCALAFASDLGLLATSLLPHKATIFDDNLFAASIDHAMWFHSHDVHIDQWLLCKTYSPWAGNARGFAQGQIFDLEEKLIASTTQEGLIRTM